MIEFKAECGHTVRARDEDSGGLVRCSYCGKPANVPEAKNEGLDHLFDEAEIAHAQEGSTPSIKKKRRQRPVLGAPRSRSGFNPFPIIVKLCYFALLLCIVIIVTNKFILPSFRSESPSVRVPNKPENPAVNQASQRKKEDSPAPGTPERGLRNRALLAGFYVTSTPPGATVLYVPMSEAAPQ